MKHDEKFIKSLEARVAALEEKLAYLSNPARQMSIAEKARITRAAMKIGTKAAMRDAARRINGQ